MGTEEDKAPTRQLLRLQTEDPAAHQEASDRILIVDDTPHNIDLLSKLLTRKGYTVQAAMSGDEALGLVHAVPPQLILLDICMPGMDGYEVCQTLKANPSTCDIPVIFLSALDEIEAKIKAFQVGGVDYVTKPFRNGEVIARVKTHLTLQRLQKDLQLQNLRLQHEVNARQQAEDQYRSIVENSVLGIFQASPDGRFLSANTALAEIYGYASAADLIQGMTNIGQQLYVRSGRLQEMTAYLRQFGQVSDFESQVYRRDGSVIWISENVRTVKDETGNIRLLEGIVEDITERKNTEAELRHQRRETERLLLSILPQPIAERLKRNQGTTIADSFDDITVMFADVVNFTALSSRIPPADLVELLNQIFSAFDQLAAKYGVEKIKTLGDGYMAAAGLPVYRPDHAEAIADLALGMQHTISQFHSDQTEPFALRIGICTGPVVAGVIGTQRFIYDLWGDTVNLASRMQSQGASGEIQVTETTYQRIHRKYELEERGRIDVKGRGEMMTYWLKGKKPNVFDGDFPMSDVPDETLDCDF